MIKPNPTLLQSISDREIVITRTFVAPRALVWEAWTKPEHIEQWWGPNGFTTTIAEFDLRPGGRFKQVMHGPDGTNYPNLSVFREVVPEKRIVYAHAGGKEGGIGASFEATWTFQTIDEDKTLVTGRMLFATQQDRDLVVKEYGAIEGGQQTLARLAQHVARSASSGEEVVIVRDLAFPREQVYAAWTSAEHLRQWWGPKGYTVVSAKLDLKVGGVFHFGLRAPSGDEMWARFVFREVEPRERLAWVHSFSNPKAETARHAAHQEWPLEMLVEVTFVDNQNGTTLTLRSRPVNATESERKVFRENHDSMRGGYGGTFDQLESFLGGQSSSAR